MTILSDLVKSVYASYLLPLLVLVVCLLCSYIPRWYKAFRYKNLPPGPLSLPFIGYIPFLNKEKSYKTLMELANRYGQVFSFYVGSRYVIVLDGFSPVKAAFFNEDFTYRPDLKMSEDQPSVTDSNGENWREQRRFLVTSFRQLGVGTEDFEHMVMAHVSEMSSWLMSSYDKTLDLNHEMDKITNSLSFHLIYGNRFEVTQAMISLLTEYNNALTVHIVHLLLGYFFPMTKFMIQYSPSLKLARKIMAQMDNVIRREITEHRETLKPNEPHDVIDHFLVQMDKSGAHETYQVPFLMGNVKSLLGMGSETTKVTIVWFFLLMAKYPEVQKRAQSEIDAYLGSERDPRYADRTNLPFVEAAILESMRIRNMLHLNPFRETVRDTTLCGFDIPRGTLVVHNMTSLFQNPTYFPRPEEFDPTRFLTEDGRELKVPEYFIPFSIGKRNCPGDKIASIILFLLATSILQRFDILPPDGGVKLDIKCQFVNFAAHPYARLVERR